MSESNTVTNRESDPNYRSVKVERVEKQRYRATNSEGASVEFGQGEGLLNPVEMLLAAIAGCSAIDVDVVTSRRSEPEVFEVKPSAIKLNEDGAVRLDDVEVSFNVRFPNDAKGKQAEQLVDRLMKLSHEKDCTVSRTVEHGANVRFINENAS
ncbi:OsmC family protein [Rothia amarae]|uniref:OsmC family protein n=1 Tax=Rothia amarae TaxID=169480 RepID=UPI0031D83F96